MRSQTCMLFMRKEGEEASLCWRRGGVGRVVGRLAEALFSSARDRLREGDIVVGGE